MSEHKFRFDGVEITVKNLPTGVVHLGLFVLDKRGDDFDYNQGSGTYLCADFDDGRAAQIAAALAPSQSEALAKDYGYWNEHPDHPWQDWMGEVQANDTRKGYWEWVLEQLDHEKLDQEHEQGVNP